jgi:hypothetical protein
MPAPNMFVEIAKPITLVSCILSLYALFHAVFLAPSLGVHRQICDSLGMLALAAGVSLIGGFIFRDSSPAPHIRLAATLPVKLFCCASSAMLILFLLSRYLETNCVFYRDVRF